MSRMLTGGEDPLYIARRLVVVASEDVGLGDPHGLPLVSSESQVIRTVAETSGNSNVSSMSNNRYARVSNQSCGTFRAISLLILIR